MRTVGLVAPTLFDEPALSGGVVGEEPEQSGEGDPLAVGFAGSSLRHRSVHFGVKRSVAEKPKPGQISRFGLLVYIIRHPIQLSVAMEAIVWIDQYP